MKWKSAITDWIGFEHNLIILQKYNYIYYFIFISYEIYLNQIIRDVKELL